MCNNYFSVNPESDIYSGTNRATFAIQGKENTMNSTETRSLSGLTAISNSYFISHISYLKRKKHRHFTLIELLVI